MRNFKFLLLLLLPIASFSQVGIGTTTPEATLDIKAKNPTGTTTNTDGILIPRVSRERAQSMTGITASTIIYVDDITVGTATGTTVNVTSKGFYYFDGTSWVVLNGNTTTDQDWYKTGTTTPPTANTDDMFHTGNVSIGKNTASASKVDISESSTAKTSVVNITHTTPNTAQTNLIVNSITSNAAATVANPYSLCGVKNILSGSTRNSSSTILHKRYGVFNDLSSPNDGGFYYGAYNTFSTTNGGSMITNKKIGVYNDYTGSGVCFSAGLENHFTIIEPGISGSKYGVNNVFDGSGSGESVGMLNTYSNTAQLGDQMGAKNVFGLTNSGRSYGVYNDMNISGNNSANYGVYTKITGSGAGSCFASGVYIDASTSLGTTQTVYGVYSKVPNNGDPTSSRYAGLFLGGVAIGTTTSPVAAADTYILPLKRGVNPNFGQVPITTGANSNREVIWSPFSFVNNSNTTAIGKNYSNLTAASDWNPGTTVTFTITDANCLSSSSISVTFSNVTAATAGKYRIDAISSDNGQFYITATNISGLNIVGAYSIPIAYTAFY